MLTANQNCGLVVRDTNYIGDFELDFFNKQGGLGKMWQLFGEETDRIIELNERLVT